MRSSPAIFLLLAAAARAEQQKLAVLEFEVQKGLVIDRRTFSGRVQNAARKAAPNLFVMTQANIETLVRAAGKTLSECEGQCAIDTGRLVGADIVIAGRISRVGRLALSMQMYETKTGELLAGEDVEANTDAELLNVSLEATARLLAPLARKPPLSGAPRTNPPASANETRHGNPKRSTGGAGPSAHPQLSAKSGSLDEVINLKGTIQVKRIDDRFSVSLDGGILVDTKTTRWWQKNIARDASWYEATSTADRKSVPGHSID